MFKYDNVCFPVAELMEMNNSHWVARLMAAVAMKVLQEKWANEKTLLTNYVCHEKAQASLRSG